MTKLLPLLPWLVLAACQTPPTPNAFGEPRDPHSHDKLFAVSWMRESAEYAACCRQAFAVAARALDLAIADASLAALPNVAPSGARPAVITDLDETLLDNLAYQEHLVRDGVEFGGGGWTAWVQSGRATLLPGAADFLRHATAVADVFYVSNRATPEHAAATLAALAAVDARLADEPHRLLLLANGQSGDKQARRDQVAKTHRVVLLLGDDLGDFVRVPKVDPSHALATALATRNQLVAEHAQQWGTTWILLPNPAYGSWARLYEGADAAATHRQRLARFAGERAFVPVR